MSNIERKSRLTFINITENGKALYKCSCGVFKEIRIYHVSNSITLSCGCYKKEKASEFNTHHGYVNHPLYSIWEGMRRRCYNPKFKNYKNYGGRGVKVCDEWNKNAASFIEWALKNGYKKGLQLDKDSKGDGLLYSPETCCFLTSKENNRYRRNNNHVTINGSTKTLTEWSDESGVKLTTLLTRLQKGCDESKLLIIPNRLK